MKCNQKSCCKETDIEHKQCSECRARKRKYQQSKKGKESQHRWNISDKGRANKRTEKSRAINTIAVRKYVQTEKGRCIRDAYRQTHQTDPEHRVRRLGLSSAEEEQKAVFALLSFKGKCECCGTDDPGNRGFVVDHCHTRLIFRGILCNRCNIILGLARDSVTHLQSIIEFLHHTK